MHKSSISMAHIFDHSKHAETGQQTRLPECEENYHHEFSSSKDNFGIP